MIASSIICWVQHPLLRAYRLKRAILGHDEHKLHISSVSSAIIYPAESIYLTFRVGSVERNFRVGELHLLPDAKIRLMSRSLWDFITQRAEFRFAPDDADYSHWHYYVFRVDRDLTVRREIPGTTKW